MRYSELKDTYLKLTDKLDRHEEFDSNEFKQFIKLALKDF
jgi:hypothetical protein